MKRLIGIWSLMVVLLCSSFLISAFALPGILEFFEARRSTPLPYEAVIRIAILFAHFLLLGGATFFLLRKNRQDYWIAWTILFISALSLFVIFFGDTTHRLMEEFSWIRYTTSAFLILASLTALSLAIISWKKQNDSRSIYFLWGIISLAFLYGGLDEVMEIHEAIGRFLRIAFRLPEFITDYVTIAYAGIALIVILTTAPKFLSAYKKQLFALSLFVWGGFLYAISTVFDTADFFILGKLHALAVKLAKLGVVFTDQWYFLWSPRNLLNGIEEVFEHTAAVLFFTACFLILWNHLFTSYNKQPSEGQGKKNLFGMLWLIVFFSITGIAFVSSLPFLAANSPLKTPTVAIATIATDADGLFHADDLFFHKKWGILLANEGRHNIFQWKNGAIKKLPDPQKILRDTDSLTATDKEIYIADGSQGIIFRYTESDGFQPLWTKKDGLKHPEGIVVVGETIYGVDESEQIIFKLSPKEKIKIWKPPHKHWKAPEGIAYDTKTGSLIITDDVSGSVFRVYFEKSIEEIAKFANPEDVEILSDGTILLTDNGFGAVFSIAPNGSIKMELQFNRSYRDTQGIAVDDANAIYVVTSNGFDNTSFMPSFLFKIKRMK